MAQAAKVLPVLLRFSAAGAQLPQLPVGYQIHGILLLSFFIVLSKQDFVFLQKLLHLPLSHRNDLPLQPQNKHRGL